MARRETKVTKVYDPSDKRRIAAVITETKTAYGEKSKTIEPKQGWTKSSLVKEGLIKK